jgi:hypothetical protein
MTNDLNMIRQARGVELKNAVKVTERRVKKEMNEIIDRLKVKFDEEM